MPSRRLTYVALIVCTLFLFVCHRKQSNYKIKKRWIDEEPVLVFTEKPLVIWTTDLHFSPIHDLKTFLKPMGVRFIDKNLDYTRCHHVQTCEGMKTLQLLNPSNAMHLDYSLIEKFYQLYANDSEIQSADAFACFHAPALCELYEPFNKTLIIISTIRYELGRFDKERWTRWNENLVRYASDPKHLVAANNLYDVNYIKYFTGIEPLWIPSFSSHSNCSYSHSREGFLMAHNTNPDFDNIFVNQYLDLCKVQNCTVSLKRVRDMYKNYKYSDIAAHQGIVHVPYQVSVMSFFEQYRMNIPLFAPSKELLIMWEWTNWAMRERTWKGAHGPQPVGSDIGPHPSQRLIPDPNSYTEQAVRYWVPFCDYYQFPHIIYYNSIEHLIKLMNSTTTEELIEISGQMRIFNVNEERRLRKQWRHILQNTAKHSDNRPH